MRNGKDTFCILSAFQPGKSQTSVTESERPFFRIGCPSFHLFTPRCPVGEDTDAQRPLASAVPWSGDKGAKTYTGFLDSS